MLSTKAEKLEFKVAVLRTTRFDSSSFVLYATEKG